MTIAVLAYCFDDFVKFLKVQPVNNRKQFQYIRTERDHLGVNVTDLIHLNGSYTFRNNFIFAENIKKRNPNVVDHGIVGIQQEFKINKEKQIMKCFHTVDGVPGNFKFCPECPLSETQKEACYYRKKQIIAQTPITFCTMGTVGHFGNPMPSHGSPVGCQCEHCNPQKVSEEKTVKQQIAELRKQLHFDEWKKIQYRYVRDFKGNIFDTYAIYKIPVKFGEYFIVQRVRLRHNDTPDSKRAKVILIGKVSKIYEQVVKTANEQSTLNNLNVLEKKELKELKLKIHKQNERNREIGTYVNSLKYLVSPETHINIVYQVAHDKNIGYLKTRYFNRRNKIYRSNSKPGGCPAS